jgi:hypothetical protein
MDVKSQKHGKVEPAAKALSKAASLLAGLYVSDEDEYEGYY